MKTHWAACSQRWSVSVEPFSTGAQAAQTFTVTGADQTGFNNAKTFVNNFVADGFTNYEAPLQSAISFLQSGAKIAGADTYTYFVSDGEPNRYVNSSGQVQDGSADTVMGQIQGSDGSNEVSTLKSLSTEVIGVGIGVNVVAYPDDLPYPATSLKALGSACDAETLFLALSDAWGANARLWNEGRGLAAIRDRWLERAAGLGSEVAVRIDGSVVRGTFETIDADCRFVIRDRNGNRQTIAAGDVHFGAVASAGAA